MLIVDAFPYINRGINYRGVSQLRCTVHEAAGRMLDRVLFCFCGAFVSGVSLPFCFVRRC